LLLVVCVLVVTVTVTVIGIDVAVAAAAAIAAAVNDDEYADVVAVVADGGAGDGVVGVVVSGDGWRSWQYL